MTSLACSSSSSSCSSVVLTVQLFILLSCSSSSCGGVNGGVIQCHYCDYTMTPSCGDPYQPTDSSLMTCNGTSCMKTKSYSTSGKVSSLMRSCLTSPHYHASQCIESMTSQSIACYCSDDLCNNSRTVRLDPCCQLLLLLFLLAWISLPQCLFCAPILVFNEKRN